MIILTFHKFQIVFIWFNLFALYYSRYIIGDKIDSLSEKSYLEHRKPASEDVEHETPLRP